MSCQCETRMGTEKPAADASPQTDGGGIGERIDVLENDIAEIDPTLLACLLQDKTTNGNILWGTKDYESYGDAYGERREIAQELITGDFSRVIQPRAAKAKEVQRMRVRQRAEVFTPSWVCNAQNDLVDEAWFGRKNVFNTPDGTGWRATEGRIVFPPEKTWKSYVTAKRLEITCGEAPYLVSRYDTTTGEPIPLYARIGLFDRKMRIVNENCSTDREWRRWSKLAVMSVYGFEFQGDSVLIARENLLYDYLDYYEARFHRRPTRPLMRSIADVIAWNIWQMDGLRFVVPYSCHETPETQTINMFGMEKQPGMLPCPGCRSGDKLAHNGVYATVMDWETNTPIRFVDMMNGGEKDGEI